MYGARRVVRYGSRNRRERVSSGVAVFIRLSPAIEKLRESPGRTSHVSDALAQATELSIGNDFSGASLTFARAPKQCSLITNVSEFPACLDTPLKKGRDLLSMGVFGWGTRRARVRGSCNATFQVYDVGFELGHGLFKRLKPLE